MAHILVADDDDLLRDVLRQRFMDEGHRVTMVGDGAAVFPAIDRDRPDVIVLDAMMPTMSGLEVLFELKRDPATESIPVIMLTARKAQSDIVGALRAGAVDYITKPFMPDELIWRLNGLFVRESPTGWQRKAAG